MATGDGYRFSLHVKKPVHAILLIFKQVKQQYNLQYFSYDYNHYNYHYINKFWQVRNLWLPFHYLPKFDFGKYVRWSCLLLAKIHILASMFVGRVCLSVCLYGNFTKSQERLNQSSPNLVTSKHQSVIPASSLDKDVGQITRSRGQKLGQIFKVS